MNSLKGFALIAAVLFMPAGAMATCSIGGHCEAELNVDNPELGTWKYTLTVEWHSGNSHGLSHLDLALGFENHECDCDDFLFNFTSPAGQSDGEHRCCTVYYDGHFECLGDPSIPGVEFPILKFEPISEDCEPDNSGDGVFVFYSDWQPKAVDTPNDYLIFKAGGNSCEGELSGVLPTLGCEHVAAGESSWGQIKTLY